MSKANRLLALALALLVVGLALCALTFGPFLLETLIKPVSGVLWIGLSILLLRVNQEELWAYILLALAVLIVVRVIRSLPRAREEAEGPDPNSAQGELEYWRYMFAETPVDAREHSLVGRELAKLLLQAYASKNRAASDAELYDAFRTGRIGLPKAVHALLFGPDEEERPARARSARKRARRRRHEYREAVEEYLDFIESHLEISDDEK